MTVGSKRLIRRLAMLCCMVVVGVIGVFVYEGFRETDKGTPGPRVVRAFPAGGVNKVIVRASQAGNATVTTDMPTTEIEVSGEAVGGAKGYHPPDPNWKETPAGEWGLEFVSERYGSVMVISTKNEIQYIHHHYALQKIKVRVPVGVEVVLQQRKLAGDGQPDLKAP